MTSQVTLYIPCYNVAEYLPEVITAVMAQTYSIAEVLIIDDCSKDNSVEIIERLAINSKYPLTLIKHPVNMGLATVRNTAVQHCKTKYLASVDADVVIAPEWLDKMMDAFNRYDNAGGIGAKMIERYTDTLGDFWRHTHLVQNWGEGEFAGVSFIFGCNSIYIKEDIVNAGMYDPALSASGEDYDISLKIRNNGKVLLYTDATCCEHLKRDSVSSVLNTNWRYIYFSGKLHEKGFLRHALSLATSALCVIKLVRKDIMLFNTKNLLLDITCFPYLIYMDMKEYFTRFKK